MRRKLLWSAVGLVALAVVAPLAAWRVHAIEASALEMRDRGLRGTADVATHWIERWLDERLRDAEYLTGGHAEGRAELARFAAARGYPAAWLVSGADGRVVAASSAARPDSQERAAIARFRCRGGPDVAGVFASEPARVQVLVMRPLGPPEPNGGGGCRDALVLRADLLPTLQPYVHSPLRSSTTGASFIVAPPADPADRTVAVLAAPSDGPLAVRRVPAAGLPPHVRAALGGHDSTFTARDLFGTPARAAVRHVRRLGWGVVRQLDVAEYRREVWRRALTEAGLAATLLLGFVWMALAHQRALRIEQLDADLARMQLDALRAQLQPHFLFNVLNGIGELIHTDGAAAELMLHRLARLLRLSLATRTDHEVPLREELGAVRAYVDIEQVRFGAKLAVHYDVAPEAEGALVPPFLLQPLVENSVKHGLQAAGDARRIEVRAARDDGMLRLTVTDDGPGPTARRGAAGAEGFGLGLATTRRRLERLYGDAHVLGIRPRAAGGTEVELRLPFRQGAPARDGER